jgi:RimJ/RimL family protein N-acetyltransferase
MFRLLNLSRLKAKEVQVTSRRSTEAITIDVLIGEEEFLGRGLAYRMVREFLLKEFSHVDQVFLDPEVANPKAVHVYEKIGFKKLERFVATWHPVPYWLMSISMKELHSENN